MIYAFRAECYPDVERFLDVMSRIGMRPAITKLVTRRKSGWPDVTCVFEAKGLSVSGLVTLLASIEDGHVMAQTVNTARKFTGKRIRNTYRNGKIQT